MSGTIGGSAPPASRWPVAVFSIQPSAKSSPGGVTVAEDVPDAGDGERWQAMVDGVAQEQGTEFLGY
jgi:hypothetical protein